MCPPHRKEASEFIDQACQFLLYEVRIIIFLNNLTN